MKYKLKKWYPSLPKDIKEGSLVVEKNGYLTNKGDVLSKKEVENNPEFWEPVKDYEILSIKWGDTEQTIKFNYNNEYEEGRWGGKWNIHSVKRLSDGEVFTVGDNFRNHNDGLSSIISFKIIEGKLRVNYVLGQTFFESIKKVKDPLFTTEDGVDIYEGDKFWFVSKRYHVYSSHGGNKLPSWVNKYFSTEEKAEEWVRMNEPYFSVNDICDIFSWHGSHTVHVKETLINYVKDGTRKNR